MKRIDKANNKQNELKEKQFMSNPVNQKILKFGKSIRAKLTNKNQANLVRASEPCQSSYSISQSTLNLNKNKPILLDLSQMSVSFISNLNQSNRKIDLQSSRSNMSKTKSVRFSDLQQSQSSLSKSNRKNHSILKNSNSTDKLSNSSGNSHAGSVRGKLLRNNLKDKGLDNENKKYQNLLKTLASQNRKFFDDMFPPGTASLFYSKGLINTRKDIRWVRIEEVFKGGKMVLLSKNDRNTVRAGQFPELNYMSTCLNALGTNQQCLEKIFQNQKYSKYGIYYLKLNHDGIWKYIIVDDFIPVKQVDKNRLEPIFFNVSPTKSNYIQIWPFILQKGLAKIYSTYQNLFNQSIQNCMFQLTGATASIMDLNIENSASNQLQIRSLLYEKNYIFMLSGPINPAFQQYTYAVYEPEKQTNTYFSCQSQLRIIQTKKSKKTHDNHTLVFLENLHSNFSKLLAYRVEPASFTYSCVIKQQSGSFSLRTFNIESTAHCYFSIIQKDKKHFRNNGYQYCWMRIFLVSKDIEGYRYINGSYGKNKEVSIQNTLTPGEYFLLIHGEWKGKVYDITLNYEGGQQIEIKREILTKYENIIAQSCRDMTQRFGDFMQLNKNVCSYQYFDRRNGFIIQNFNNQLDRQTYLHRKYDLENISFVSLGNVHFVQQEDKGKKFNKGLIKQQQSYQLETFLQKESNLTLVLMVLGGINNKFFDGFKFF